MALLTVLESENAFRQNVFPQTLGPRAAIRSLGGSGGRPMGARWSAPLFVALQHGVSGDFRKRLLELCNANNSPLLPRSHSWPGPIRPLCCGRHDLGSASGRQEAEGGS
ncbi:hypothetical protein [Azospirillum sp. TSO35-2]|uniref:hypothetical protein n=1 Tax=Azospirillum sp. TSO35-2 TaxID=716796 RepID=UPI0011B7CDCD|nr:hypothetical protein [Azospirillum sp. TSO35-2]